MDPAPPAPERGTAEMCPSSVMVGSLRIHDNTNLMNIDLF